MIPVRTARPARSRVVGPTCALALAVTAALGASSCGGGGHALTVSAAASLQRAFSEYAQRLRPGIDVRYSFAGSDALAAQIEQGLRPDVFAAANMKLPDRLHAEGLVSQPLVFARNRLVIAVPSGSPITRLGGLERPGVTLALGAPGVPIGAYTSQLLARLAPAARSAILANVRDREPDVSGIVGKLTEGAVDAGILYATDVAATHGELRAIELPPALQPEVAYGVAIVSGSPHLARARAFVAGLLRGAGRGDLLRDGFDPPERR